MPGRIKLDAIVGGPPSGPRPVLTTSPFGGSRPPLPPTVGFTASPFPLARSTSPFSPSRGGTVPPLPAVSVAASHSRAPAVIRAGAIIAKWAAMLALCLGGYFYVMRQWVFPTMQELQHPAKLGAVPAGSSASPARLIQQTRAVVAQHDANVGQVHAILATGEPVASTLAAPAHPTPAPAAVRHTAADFRQFVDRLKVSAVYQGFPPRALLDDRLVQYGDIVDWSLGVKFVGVDPRQRIVSFRDASGATITKLY